MSRALDLLAALAVAILLPAALVAGSALVAYDTIRPGRRVEDARAAQ